MPLTDLTLFYRSDILKSDTMNLTNEGIMMNRQKTAITYTLLHFFVDFTTIFLIARVIIGPKTTLANRGYVIIVYNLLAFAGQLPMGMISDIIRKNRIVAALGCAFAAISYPLSFVTPYLACVFAALGNGAFHIGAGSEILQMSMPKAGLSGLFVSGGALGVWLAYKIQIPGIIFICPVITGLCAILLFMYGRKQRADITETKIHYGKPSLTVLMAVICFMLTIVIRSLLGTVMDFSWKSVPAFSLAFVLAVAFGKAMGGFLADKFGKTKTAAVSLSISLFAFVFAFRIPFAGIIAVLCFNMTMPLTLTAIAGVCKNKNGFAFGLTTFALAMGFVPVVFSTGDLFGLPMLTISVTASLILLVTGLSLLKNVTEEDGI